MQSMKKVMKEEMRDIIIYEVLVPSFIKLYEKDYENIRFGASERNICARLAHHMENIMRRYDRQNEGHVFSNYYADVEYNRMGNGDLKHYENSEHRPVYMVSDLLIQKRGYGRNLLAVEMKRRGNHRGEAADKERLISLVSTAENENMAWRCVHDTLVGAFIIYSPESVNVELYENVNGRGKKTNEMSFVYQRDDARHGRLILEER